MGTFAQMQHNPSYSYDYYLTYYNDFNIDKTIQTQTVVYTNKKGKTNTSKFEYNKGGKIAKVYWAGKKGEMYLASNITYDQKTNKITTLDKYKKKDKLKYSMNYKWNIDSALTEISKTNRKGKLDYKSTWKYTDAKKILESKRYNNDGEDLKFIWKYVYDDKDELLQTQLFKGEKEKLKHVWDFNCHQEGEVLNKEKNTTQVCTWSEDQGKFLVKTYQRFDEKGKIRKYVSYYTLKDTVLVESKSFNSKDELISISKYNSDKKNIYWERLRKGKSIYKNVTSYNSNGDRTHYSYYKRGKLKSERSYNFNDNNNLIEEIYKNKGKFKSKTVYTYGDNNLKASYKYYNSKMKLIGSSVYSYVMY